MKSLSDIIDSDPVYIIDWKDSTEKNIWDDFNRSLSSNPEGSQILYDIWTVAGKILFASYSNENYSGSAFVLATVEGRLYEVNASHCSCFGLEDQWELEEVELEHLRFRLRNGTFGVDRWNDNNFRAELIQFLGLEGEIGD